MTVVVRGIRVVSSGVWSSSLHTSLKKVKPLSMLLWLKLPCCVEGCGSQEVVSGMVYAISANLSSIVFVFEVGLVLREQVEIMILGAVTAQGDRS
jgi:hypothetical protein